MKKIIASIIVVLMMGCNENGTLNKEKLDSAGHTIQHTVQRGIDTIGSKLDKLEDKLENYENDTVVDD